MNHNHSETSINLIHAVRSHDNPAWERLCTRYTPMVVRWIRKAGLSEWDTADVVQNVFEKVASNIQRFRKEKEGDSFRGWLWTVTRNEIRAWFRAQKRNPERVLGGSAANAMMKEIPEWIDDDSVSERFYRSDRSRTKQVQLAAQNIRGDFAEHTWQAFWRSTVEGHSTADIADDLKMSRVAVRQAKFRVLARMREYLS